ncbi:MAG: PAS domain-containing protein [Gammaproteobacteria bacterium]|nr:PAS domain-containing protein [Gammaproteobacteria bacterium]
MDYVYRRRTLWVLIAILACVVAGVAISSIAMLYRTAYRTQLQNMQAEVETLAGLFESIGQFDQLHSAQDHPQGAWGATMSQIERALKGHGATHVNEEILLGRRDGEELVVLQAVPGKGFQELMRIPFDGRRAQALYRGLIHERGSGELVDYNGDHVLAAYAPVPTLGIAIATKITLAEFRRPFARAGVLAAEIGLLVIGIGVFGFIGATRPLERRLMQSEQRFTALVAEAPVGVYEADAHGNCTFVNAQWCDLAGLGPDVAQGKGWVNALHPDDRPAYVVAWNAFVAGRASFQHEYRFLRPDGTARWLYGQASVLRGRGGVITGYTGTITDITERKNAEVRFSEAQRLAKVGSWELDLRTNTLIWSDEIFRIFEIDKQQFGASYEAFLDAIHPDDRDIVNRAYSDSLAKRTPYVIVHRLKMADGRIKYVRETCESFFDTDGKDKPLRSVGTVQDITELHKAEEELRRHRERLEELVQERTARLAESERQLRRAQEIAHLGHWSVNLVSGELHWSDEIYRIFGRDPAQFQPSYDNFFACVHPDDHARVKESEQESFRSGRHSIDHRVVHPDGTIRWVHEEAQLERDAEGQPLRLTGTVQDITARKQAEDELLHAKEEAERANRAKSEFLSRMSHELRTPLNAILGFAQVLEVEPLGSEPLEFVHEIHRAGDHLLELINELLDLSRIEAGKLTMVLQPTSVAQIAHEAAQIVQPQVIERHIILRDACDEQALVLADPVRLRQILVNLLSNAVKYNRVGGQVLLGCRLLGDEWLRITVTDTGNGIAPEKLTSLFKPFERLGAEFSAIDGTGIGLALSKQLAELMGGVLGLDTVAGEGSTFWVDLPRIDAAAAQVVADMPPVVEHATDGERIKVLYVEDNPANLKVVKAMLRHHPKLHLLSATNGEYGLELARRYLPDVILLDIHLPGMDGYAVFDALQADAETRRIPVIALSADAMPIDIEKGMRAGFRHYLTKPVKVGELIGAVMGALGHDTHR